MRGSLGRCLNCIPRLFIRGYFMSFIVQRYDYALGSGGNHVLTLPLTGLQPVFFFLPDMTITDGTFTAQSTSGFSMTTSGTGYVAATTSTIGNGALANYTGGDALATILTAGFVSTNHNVGVTIDTNAGTDILEESGAAASVKQCSL